MRQRYKGCTETLLPKNEDEEGRARAGERDIQVSLGALCATESP